MSEPSEILGRRQPAEPAATKRADDYAAYIYLGKMYKNLGNVDEALAEFARAHALRPSPETEGIMATLRMEKAARKRSAASLLVRRAA